MSDELFDRARKLAILKVQEAQPGDGLPVPSLSAEGAQDFTLAVVRGSGGQLWRATDPKRS